MNRLFLLSIFFVSCAGCVGITNLSPIGFPVERDLRGASEICVAPDGIGFDEVAFKYFQANNVPVKIAADCELRFESSAEMGWDLGEYVKKYTARVFLGDELIGEQSVRQPDNIDLGKFGFSDLVKTAIDALKILDKQVGSLDVEVYNIDLTRVTVMGSPMNSCDTAATKIVVEGQISPDSSFAMSRLLDRLQPCRDSSGREILPVTVSLQSGGGLLEDGYLMGEIFRERGVATLVENGKACASSCAVAFLGGTKRLIEGDAIIMYHAPYFSGENVYGKRDIDCEVGKEALDELNAYYRKMTDAETGDRLFERTMWYCSAEDGWVVQGGSAAELYGIATEK